MFSPQNPSADNHYNILGEDEKQSSYIKGGLWGIFSNSNPDHSKSIRVLCSNHFMSKQREIGKEILILKN